MNSSYAEPFVCVPIDAELYLDLAKRTEAGNTRGLIEHIVADYLERTEDDWVAESRSKTGRKEEGLLWGSLFLPTGTRFMMEYRGKQHSARVDGNSVEYNSQTLESPSQLARVIANNTSRNAWRDLWIKRPKDHEWIQADELRNQKKQKIDPSEFLQQLFDK